jgi:hypothetical protein
MGPAVVWGCDASPVLQADEGVLDAMALTMQGLVVFDHGLASLVRRDFGSDGAGGQRCAETVTAVALVGQ